MIYVLDGKGWVEVSSQKHLVVKNCFFVIPASTAHSYWADDEAPWLIYWVHFKGNKSVLFKRLFNEVVQISESQIARTEDRIDLFNETIGNLTMG